MKCHSISYFVLRAYIVKLKSLWFTSICVLVSHCPLRVCTIEAGARLELAPAFHMLAYAHKKMK